MAFDPVNSVDIVAGKPTKQELFTKTKGNQDDHESRIAGIEATISVQTITGEVKEFAGGVPPSGWLFADGDAVSRATYADLFAVVGTAYGVGDGSTTFNLPDRRGRFAMGVNNVGLPNGANGALATRNRGDSGGNEDITLITNNLPSHTHSITPTASLDLYPPTGSVSNFNKPRSQGFDASDGASGIQNIQTVTDATGSGTPKDVMNPYVTSNFIIKT